MIEWVPFLTEKSNDKLDREIVDILSEMTDNKDSEYYIKDDKLRAKINELGDKYFNLTFNFKMENKKL